MGSGAPSIQTCFLRVGGEPESCLSFSNSAPLTHSYLEAFNVSTRAVVDNLRATLPVYYLRALEPLFKATGILNRLAHLPLNNSPTGLCTAFCCILGLTYRVFPESPLTLPDASLRGIFLPTQYSVCILCLSSILSSSEFCISSSSRKGFLCPLSSSRSLKTSLGLTSSLSKTGQTTALTDNRGHTHGQTSQL